MIWFILFLVIVHFIMTYPHDDPYALLRIVLCLISHIILLVYLLDTLCLILYNYSYQSHIVYMNYFLIFL